VCSVFLDFLSPHHALTVTAHDLQETAIGHRSVAAIPSLESSFALYIEEIRRFSMLAPKKEFILAQHWREYEDSDRAQAGPRAICGSWPKPP
jgi:hypothetical protein